MVLYSVITNSDLTRSSGVSKCLNFTELCDAMVSDFFCINLFTTVRAIKGMGRVDLKSLHLLETVIVKHVVGVTIEDGHFVTQFEIIEANSALL